MLISFGDGKVCEEHIQIIEQLRQENALIKGKRERYVEDIVPVALFVTGYIIDYDDTGQRVYSVRTDGSGCP